MFSKKSLSFLLSLLLIVSIVLMGCTSKKEVSSEERKKNLENLNKEGMPIAKEKITLNGFAAKFYSSQDWSNLMLWKEYEKKTNMHINWKTVSTDALEEKRNLMLASSDYPDLLFSAAVPKTDLLKYGKQGVFLKLNDLIDEYAPNFKKLMEEYPIIKKGITMPDGNIYGFPTIYDPNFKSLFMGTPWIKKEWLDKVGMKEPTTMEEFYQVLKAFKEKDPNGNGKADEIPWGGGYGIEESISYLRGSFGLNNHGTANRNIDLDEKTGKLRFVPSTDNYKKLLEFLNKLYKEELIDKEIFTIKPHEFNSKVTNGNYGVINGIDPGVGNNQKGYVGIPVLEGPNGDRKYTAIGSPLGNIGMFVITDKNKYPEQTIRWIDYFYGEEGIKNFFMGFEGITYKETANGEVEYTDEITKNPDGLTLDQAISKYLTWPGGYYPGMVKQKYFKGAEGQQASIENAKKAESNTIQQEEIWPAFNFDLKDQEELSSISTDIQTYVDEMTAKFITGKSSFSEWDKYVKTLEKMGLEKYMEIYTNGYKNFKGSK